MTLASNRLGLLFMLVAPAGAGKNALMNRVMARLDGLRQLPTATTRPIRPTEQQGREHLFVTHDEFARMLANDELLEHQQVHDNFYGIPRKTVEDAMDAGEDLIADVDYLGADYTRSQYPDNVTLIFVQPPSVEALIQRMRERGDKETDICRRLLRVPAELAYAPQCDYLIVNDDIDEAAEILYGIIIAARSAREVARLRAAPERNRHAFEAVSAAVVVHDDFVAWGPQAPFLPHVLVNHDEAPHAAALRAARQHLGHTLQPDELVHLSSEKTELVPPVSVDFIEGADGQQVMLLYICRAGSRFELPAGWAWLPLVDAPLPQRVRDTLATSPT